MIDYYGHGTSVATLVAGRGREVYPLGFYDNTTVVGTIKGVAPNSKIAAGSMLWATDDTYLELWLAGFEPVIYPVQTGTGIIYYIVFNPYGPRRADIISNSWAYIYLMFWAQNAPGTDLMSAFFDNIVVTRTFFVGEPVVLVFAAGNEGPGYGSLGSPSAGLMVITVGASTWYKSAMTWGRNGLWDDIATFSSRGPNSLGYPKPDVVNIGAWEYAGTRTIDGEGYGATADLFGGTSEATPLTSGVLALIAQAFKEYYNMTLNPVVAKIILKSSADDLGYPAFMQGAGRVNAYKAIKTVLEGGWLAFITEGISEAFLENYLNMYGQYAINITEYLADTAYYAVVPPGSSKNFTLYLMGFGEARLEAQELVEYKEYVAFNGVYDFRNILRLDIPRYAYSYSDYIEIIILYENLTYRPYEFQLTPIDLEHPIFTVVYDWRDHDRDGVVDDDEVYYITEDYRYGVETILSISRPSERIEGQLRVVLAPAEYNVTPVKVKVVVKAYKYVDSDIIYLPSTIYSTGLSNITVNVNVPSTILPGIREIRLVIDTPTTRVVVPVSILVPVVLDNISTTIVGLTTTHYRYDSFKLRGVYDVYYGVWEGCDWRILPVMITDPEITGVLFIARWGSGYASDLAFTIVPPGGVFNSVGSPNLFSTYKLAYDLGLVYNPSIRDQIRGKLRMYLPVKWGLPVRSIEVNVLALSLYPPIYTVFTAEENIRPISIYGVYRIVYGFTSYSGRYVDDRVVFRIVTIRSTAKYIETSRQDELSIGYVEFEFKAGAYAPFVFTELYMVTTSPSTYPLIGIYTYIPTCLYGEGVIGNMYYYLVSYSFGYYIGLVLAGNYIKSYIPVVVNVSETPEIDIIMLNYQYPWHAEGLYLYFEGYGVYVIEIIYPGVMTATTTISS